MPVESLELPRKPKKSKPKLVNQQSLKIPSSARTHVCKPANSLVNTTAVPRGSRDFEKLRICCKAIQHTKPRELSHTSFDS